MSAEVICISSDEDEVVAQDSGIAKSSNNTKPVLNKSEEAISKRKNSFSLASSDSPPRKRAKLLNESEKSPEGHLPLKPSLIVKTKRSVSPVDHHPFPMFVSLCLQKDRADDMQHIVKKLKRAFERLDNDYKNSKVFKDFVNEQRNAMMSDKKNTYIYIKEVLLEMKDRINGSSSLFSNPETNNEKQDESEDEETQRTNSKIARLDTAMQKVEKRIKKLESAEVDFEDENDSTYIKLESYKRRMVDLYRMRCRLTGDSTDAGRSYLRPRRLKPTGISAIDDAVTKFVNTKISKRNKLKNSRSTVDAFVFPNYSDILGCIHQCNEDQSLGFNSSRLENIAEAAFTQMGEHLQKVRRKDYWDTFSLYLENQEEDPATTDAVLAAKLDESQREGQKRLANVIQKYVDEQEKQNGKEEEEVGEDEESEDESVEDEEEEKEEESEMETPSENGEAVAKPESMKQDSSPVIAQETPAKNSVCPDETFEERVSVEPVPRNPPVNLPSCDTPASSAVPLRSPTVSHSGSEDEGTPVLETGLPNHLAVIDQVNLAEECDGDKCASEDEESSGTREEKPLLRLRSFAKPPTTWNDAEKREKSPEFPKSPVDLVDLTESSSPARSVIGRVCPKSICIVKNINNNNNEPNGKRIKVIPAGKVTVLNQVLATNGSTLRMAKSLAGAQVIKVITNRTPPGNCARKRIQPQTIAVLHPTTSAGKTK